MLILVRDLPETVSQESLSGLFAKFGTVASATIITDVFTGRSRGFGFVEIADDAAAAAAIAALHRSPVEGKRIRVKEADPKYGPGFFEEESKRLRESGPRPQQESAGPTPRKYKRRAEHAGVAPEGQTIPTRPGARHQPPEGAGRPAVRYLPREERPGYRPHRAGGFKARRPGTGFQREEGGRPEYKPRREGGYAPRRYGPGSERPRAEGGFGPRRTGPGGNRPGAGFQPREGGRPGYPPRREGGFSARRESTGFQSREGGRPEYGQRREGGFGRRREGPGGSRPGTGFHRGEGRPGYPPRGERGFSQRGPATGGRPHGKFRPSGDNRPMSKFRRDRPQSSSDRGRGRR